jgi:WD40 repeat protein
MPDGCVSETDLRALVLGELPDGRAAPITEHLRSCTNCEGIARRIDESIDPFLRSLRRAVVADAPGGPAGGLPEHVAGYRVLGELGRGGMGVVYKASQERPRRFVALKMILAGSHAGPDRRARLLAEADAIARLNHPHIVQIYEAGEHDGLPFLALEYMAGGTLATLLDGLPQSPGRAAALAETLARAVAHAHAAGVIHRDLKPSNVLLADDGTPKVSDFGLAKQGDVDLTATGAVLGTPSYMAPEQAAGSRVVGPAADVYAVGAILYELLTGRPPFRAATPLETLDQVRTQEPVPVRQLQHRVPRDLETVCLKCLEKDPARRYPGAGELADDLRRFLDDRPVRARRVSAWGRLRRWVHREPALAGMSAAVALLLLTLLAGTLVANWRLNRTAERALASEREATDRLFEALLTRVEAGRGSGRPGQRFAGKEAIRQAADIARAQGRPAEDFLRLRNEAIACLALPDLALEQQWDGNPPGTVSLGLDPRFQRYAWGRKDEPLSLRRLQDHGELFRLPVLPSDRVSRWARSKFSPDGRYLAVFYRQWSEKRPVEVWDLEGGRQRPTVVLHDVAAVPDFAADGRALAARLADGTVVLIDLPSGHERRRFRPGAPSEALALHRDGRLVAVSSSAPDRVQVCDLATGAVTCQMPHSAKVVALAWAPDGRLLASSCDDQQVHLWDGLTGQKQGALTGHRWGPEDLAFDPSGRWLASFGWDMTLRVWDPGTQRQLLDLEEIRVVSFRTRGGLAAAGVTGRQACVWAFRPSEVYDELSFPATVVECYDFSPDGRRVAAVGPGAGLRVWDVRDRSEVCSVPGMRSVAWGPDWSWYLTTGENGYSRGAVHVLPGEGGAPDRLRLDAPELLDGVREDTRGQFLSWARAGPPPARGPALGATHKSVRPGPGADKAALGGADGQRRFPGRKPRRSARGPGVLRGGQRRPNPGGGHGTSRAGAGDRGRRPGVQRRQPPPLHDHGPHLPPGGGMLRLAAGFRRARTDPAPEPADLVPRGDHRRARRDIGGRLHDERRTPARPRYVPGTRHAPVARPAVNRGAAVQPRRHLPGRLLHRERSPLEFAASASRVGRTGTGLGPAAVPPGTGPAGARGVRPE